MAEVEQGMINQENALEEQRRNAEEAAEAEQRRLQHMELITQIADLEREWDKYTNRLRRLNRQTLSRFNFEGLENTFIITTDLNSRLNSRINDWADLLESDEEGNPIYPDRGLPEYCYSPEAEDFSRKTKVMEEVLTHTQEIMIRFLISLPAPEQLILSQEARSAFLKDPEAAKAHYHVLDQEEEEERAEENIILNGENNGDCQEDLQDAKDCDFIPIVPQSRRNSIDFFKCVRIWRRSYQSQKRRINKLLTELEANPYKYHSKQLEKQAALLSTMLIDLDITGIISLADNEPDFIKVFGETEDNVSD